MALLSSRLGPGRRQPCTGRSGLWPRSRALGRRIAIQATQLKALAGSETRPGRPQRRRFSACAAVATAAVSGSEDAGAASYPLRVVFAAGGTGGHVYPAIAIAEALRMLPLRPPVQVSFIGTQERLEHRAVAAAGFEFHALTAPSLRRPLLSWQNLLLPGRLLWSLVQAWRLLRRMRPDVVVGTGGYISFPTCLAAALQGRPLVIQEQNAAPGIANRILARFATLVFIAFQAASSRLPHCKGHLTGNPMRAGLGMLSQAAARAQLGLPDGDYPVLCILGGSLGAAALNKAVAANLSELLGLDPGLHVIWQTGERYLQAVTGSVDTHHRLKLVPFIHSMAAVYAAADLVVSRAGAITCSELLVTATPALLVPSPNVAEDHQTQNALAMEATGAASCLSEASLAADLLPCVASLLKDPMRLTAMRQAALLAGQSNAASIIAEAVVDIASRRHPCKWQSTAVSQR